MIENWIAYKTHTHTNTHKYTHTHINLLFPIDKSSVEDGPPYGVELDETINLFSKYFTLVKKEKPTNSIERRIGREVFVIFKKNGQ